jgi:hypothetical protein
MGTEKEIQTTGTAQNPEPKKAVSSYFRWWKNPTDRFSFLLVIVTFLISIATFLLYCATRELVRDAAKTAERQLRAYISIFPFTLVVFKPALTPMVLLRVKNYGATPIRNGRVQFGFNIAASNAEQDYTVADDSMIVSKQAIGIPPSGGGDAIPLRLSDGTKVTSEEEFTKVSKNGNVIVVKGIFIYDDIFKIERHTHFCYAFDWNQITKYTTITPDKQLLGAAGASYCKYGMKKIKKQKHDLTK